MTCPILCSVQWWSERAVCDHQTVYGHIACPYYTAMDTRRQAQMVHVTSNLCKSNKFSVACTVPIYGCQESNFIGYCAQHGLKMRLTALLKECPPFLHTPYNSHTTGSSTVGCMKQWCDMCVMRPLQFCFLMDWDLHCQKVCIVCRNRLHCCVLTQQVPVSSVHQHATLRRGVRTASSVAVGWLTYVISCDIVQ